MTISKFVDVNESTAMGTTPPSATEFGITGAGNLKWLEREFKADSLSTETKNRPQGSNSTSWVAFPVDSKSEEERIHGLRMLYGSTPSLEPPAPSAPVVVMNRWEGIVTDLDDESFEGEFKPVGEDAPVLQASFLLSQVDGDDLELVQIGALFTIVTSKVRIRPRHWQSTSSIQFRRIPMLSEYEVEGLVASARELSLELFEHD